MGDIALSLIGLSCAQTGLAVSARSEVFLGCLGVPGGFAESAALGRSGSGGQGPDALSLSLSPMDQMPTGFRKA
ncbi:hypothetical protein LX32DRAFT_646760 [Colletotrichum zoysiae]|uniref:Uncharacterized protein n=1 Tax=Colletotrichum zoysiae TaxID=1216348 RepID=A0AAD9LUM8_9PEZI|nr:hypothetical protein LX32DRAFT_646760 [Colletotrichum zoysiae]